MTIYQDDKLVKRAYTKVSYTKEQVDELRACMDPITGPEYFISSYMYIQHPTRGKQKLELYDFQHDLLKTYTNYRKSINLLGRQLGKGLCLNTPILTPVGFTNIRDLKEGDTIFGQDGKETKITHITEIHNDLKCYEIEFMHGEKIIVDEEHLWNITLKNKDYLVNTIELVEKFNKYKNKSTSFHIKHCDPIEFHEKQVSISPYLMGLWLGDGTSSNGEMTCTRDDYEIYKEKITSLGYQVGEFKPIKESEVAGRFKIIGFKQQLKDLNLLNNKHIMNDYLFNNIENRVQLLCGLMDTDGSAAPAGFSQFYQSNEKFIDDVRFLLSSLGIKSTKSMKKTGFKDAFILTFSTSRFEIFSLPRKLQRQKNLLNHPKNLRIYIRDIKEIKSVPTRCLQVDNEDKLFLIGKTLIPTHNSTIASGFLLWYAMFNDDMTILITSNKYDGAQEIMQRIRFAYESIPDHIRAGAKEYNKRSMVFDNGSRIVATTTTETTGRGMSLSLVYCLGGENTVTVRDKETGEVKIITLGDLYNEMHDML